MAVHDRTLQMLGICKRAGKLVAGFDAVEAAARDRLAKLVLLSEGLSDRTKRKAEEFCMRYETPCKNCSMTLEEIEWMIGRQAGVLAVTDEGLANKMRTLIGQEEEENSL